MFVEYFQANRTVRVSEEIMKEVDSDQFHEKVPLLQDRVQSISEEKDSTFFRYEGNELSTGEANKK